MECETNLLQGTLEAISKSGHTPQDIVFIRLKPLVIGAPGSRSAILPTPSTKRGSAVKRLEPI